MDDYLRQKDIEDFRKYSHYKVGDRITYDVFGQRPGTTGTIIKVVHVHIRPSDGREIPFHYSVRGDNWVPGSHAVVFPKDILDGPAVMSRPMNVFAGADRMVGSVDNNGNIYDHSHRLVGSVDNNGNIYDHSHRLVGSVDNNGNIYDHTRRIVGSVHYLGFVREHTEKLVGSVTGIHGGKESIYLAGGAGLLLLLIRNK